MIPTITVLGYEISMYSIFALVGIICAVVLFAVLHRQDKTLNSVQMVNIPIVSILGIFIGAHLLYGITHIDHIWWVLCHLNVVFSSWEMFIAYMGDIFGGMVFYGGLIGGLLAGGIYCKCMKLDLWLYADAYAPSIPLFHAFGRIGCFMSGCCYGIESSWGFVYENALSDAANGVVRVPIQLIEAGGNLLICAMLIFITCRHKYHKGTLICLYLFSYAVLRFIMEFFRGDEIRGIVLGLSTSQWISLLILIVVSIWTVRLYRPKYQTKNGETSVS
ncbi:MAG: prolipoprotein diacylglyceryl transferase [Acutalibacteraceae bacterium]